MRLLLPGLVATPVIPEFRRERQAHHCQFQARQGHRVRFTSLKNKKGGARAVVGVAVEHWLLSQRAAAQSPDPTWQLTTVNSSPKGYKASPFRPLGLH